MSRPKPIHLADVRASAIRGPRADGRWYWRARRKGVRDTLGTWWGTRDEAAVAVAQLVAGGLPEPVSHAAVPRVGATVADLLGAWVAHQEARVGATSDGLAEASATAYRQRAEAVAGELGDVLLAQLVRADVQGMVDTLTGAGVALRTQQSLVRVLRMAWTWGRKRGHTPDRPLELTRIVPQPRGYVYNDRTPTRDEVRRILDALDDSPAARAVHVLAWTGMRVSECVGGGRLPGLLAGGIHARHIEVDGKGGRRRRVPVGATALRRLRAWSAGLPPEAQVVPAAARTIHRVLAAACDAAGVERVTPHGLRRAVVMRLLEVANPKRVSLITGHSVQVLLADYDRPSDEDLARAMLAANLDDEGGTVVHLADRSQ